MYFFWSKQWLKPRQHMSNSTTLQSESAAAQAVKTLPERTLVNMWSVSENQNAAHSYSAQGHKMLEIQIFPKCGETLCGINDLCKHRLRGHPRKWGLRNSQLLSHQTLSGFWSSSKINHALMVQFFVHALSELLHAAPACSTVQKTDTCSGTMLMHKPKACPSDHFDLGGSLGVK